MPQPEFTIDELHHASADGWTSADQGGSLLPPSAMTQRVECAWSDGTSTEITVSRPYVFGATEALEQAQSFAGLTRPAGVGWSEVPALTYLGAGSAAGVDDHRPAHLDDQDSDAEAADDDAAGAEA